MFNVSGKLKRMKKCSNRQNEAWKMHFKSRQRAPSAAGLLAAAPRWTKLCGTLLDDSHCLIDVVKVSLLIRNKNITCKYIFFFLPGPSFSHFRFPLYFFFFWIGILKCMFLYTEKITTSSSDIKLCLSWSSSPLQCISVFSWINIFCKTQDCWGTQNYPMFFMHQYHLSLPFGFTVASIIRTYWGQCSIVRVSQIQQKIDNLL